MRALRDPRRMVVTGLVWLVAAAPAAWGGLVGQWDFDDPANLTKATAGADLVVQGGVAAASGIGAGDGAVDIGVGSYFRCTPNIAPNGGSATFVNEYSLVYDIFLPVSSDGQWRCLLQTNPANTGDGDYFLSPSNTIGVGEITYSSATVAAGAWYRIVFAADVGSNIHGGSPPGSFVTTVTDMAGNGWTFRHASQAVNGRHALRSTANGNSVLLFADENGEDALVRVSRVQLYDHPLSAGEVQALGGPLVPDPNNRPPTLAAGPAGPMTAQTGQAASFVFTAGDEDNDSVMVRVDWGDGTTSTSAFLPAGQPLALDHAWAAPGAFEIKAQARDEHGATSAEVTVQSVTVTGPAVVTFRTPPYLQNVRTDGIVIMTESDQNTGLAVEYGESLTYGSTAPMTRVASGGGSWFQRAVLTGLAPEGEYYYRLTTTGGEPVTTPAHFHTAPAREVDFKFSAWADSQGHNHGAWTANPLEPTVSMMKHMVQAGVAFGIGNGDLAEDGGSYADTRSYYLDRVARHLGTSVPWFAAWGNHDSASPSAPLRLASDMPSRYRAGFSPGHGSFSFTYSNCFFVCLDHFYRSEVTNGWLAQQLSSPEARNARFRFLGIHVPPYCERWIDGDAALRSTLVPLLETHKVDICFSGHTHEYERGNLNHVHYVVTGGGSWLDHPEVVVKNWEHMIVGGAHNLPGTWARQSSPGVLGPPQPIIGGLVNEYTLITIRDRYLKLEAQGFNADGSAIGVLDSFEIGVDPGPDTDGDGLRDAWESAHGLDPGNAGGANGAAGDPDGDTQTNLAEQRAGTDPKDPRSLFAVTGTEATAAGVSVTWSSVPGRSYGIRVSSDLGVWNPLLDGASEVVIGPATGPSLSHTIPWPDSPRLFVQVIVR